MPEQDRGTSTGSSENKSYRGDQSPNQVGDEGTEPNHPTGLRMSSMVLIIIGIALVFLIVGYFVMEARTDVDSGKMSDASPITTTTFTV